MERYTLKELFANQTSFSTLLTAQMTTRADMLMASTLSTDVIKFVARCIYGYFYDDLVAYTSEDDDISSVRNIFGDRLSYDIAVKYDYWARKYNYIKTLLTSDDISLLQTSKMTSSSEDLTRSAGGSLQKGATTPTGVSTGTAEDEIDVIIGSDGSHEITTDGFVDKYTNHQQKYANASRIEGERSGEILREGSIEDLLKVLEKLPSSFADEITKAVQKHFIFDYDGVMDNIY